MAKRHGGGVSHGSGQPRMKLEGVPQGGQVKGGVNTKKGPASGVTSAPRTSNPQAAANEGASQAKNPRN